MPNKSPEPTAFGAVRSAVAVHVASRRWLSFFRSGQRRCVWSFRIQLEPDIHCTGSFRLRHSLCFLQACRPVGRQFFATRPLLVQAFLRSPRLWPFWKVAPSRLRILRRSLLVYRMVCTYCFESLVAVPNQSPDANHESRRHRSPCPRSASLRTYGICGRYVSWSVSSIVRPLPSRAFLCRTIGI